MTYSCAIFSRGAQTLEEAQETKLELVASKLELKPGMRVLDVGCGWGSFAIHAARELRRQRHGRDALPGPGRARARARDGGGSRTSGRDPGGRLPPAAGGRPSTRSPASAWPSTSARRQIDLLRQLAVRAAAPGGSAAEPRDRRPGPRATTRSRTSSRRATCSPTASRCRCRGSSSRSSGRAFETTTSRASGRTTR